jgi:hypothetical protein
LRTKSWLFSSVSLIVPKRWFFGAITEMYPGTLAFPGEVVNDYRSAGYALAAYTALKLF